MKTVAILSAAVLAAWFALPKSGSPARAASPAERAYLVRFGTDARAGVDWSGAAASPQLRIAGWQFGSADRLEGLSWTARTEKENYWDTPYEAAMRGTSRREKTTERGILAVLPQSAQPVRVETRQGSFSFEPSLAAGDAPRTVLDGRASVQAVPAAQRLTNDDLAEDYPSVLETRDGVLWVAWHSFDGRGEQVWVRSLKEGTWSTLAALAEPGGDYFRTGLAQDGAGRIWAVWSAQQKGNFDLWARAFDGKAWSHPERLTSAENSDIFHALATDAAGRVHLVWQSARSGDFDIYSRMHDGKRWGPETRISTSPASDWEPAIAASPDGRVTVVWDTYDRGSYDVVARTLSKGQWEAVQAVADGPAFQARASARYDRKGRLWVAYDEADPNWGKDYGNGVAGGGRGLMVRRQSRIAVVENGQVLETPPPVDSLPEDLRQAAQHPMLALDREDRPWLLFKARVNLPAFSGEGKGYRGSWRLYGTTWRDGRWTPAFEFDGYGRIDMAAALCARSGGSMAAVWASDGRTWSASKPGRHDLLFAEWAAPSGGAGPPLAARPQQPPAEPVHPAEAADLARVRGWRATAGGRTYRIVRGDLHRHTDLSWDGNRDGSLDDSYRYAIDAAGFDFLGVCDHQAGESIPYNWQRLQKAVDLYTIRGRFAPLYSYERSLPWPNGHRNVFFAERGRPILEIAPAEVKGVQGAGSLYAYLRKFAGVTSSHTSATGAGTDWRDSDADLEPVVEIYQGYRNSFEGPGTPRAAGDKEASRFAAGFVWKAWEKGIRLGVQSSSDHVSTHISYAAFWVDAVDRAAVIAAMKARRTYAATDNLVIEARLGDTFMGGELAAGGPPPLSVVVAGTGPIASVEVIRGNRVVYSVPGAGSEVRFTWTDREPPPGTSWYYVRAVQRDGQVAWGSPVWFRAR